MTPFPVIVLYSIRLFAKLIKDTDVKYNPIYVCKDPEGKMENLNIWIVNICFQTRHCFMKSNRPKRFSLLWNLPQLFMKHFFYPNQTTAENERSTSYICTCYAEYLHYRLIPVVKQMHIFSASSPSCFKEKGIFMYNIYKP